MAKSGMSAAAESGAIKMISPKDLNSLFAASKSAAARASEITGAVGEQIGKAIEQKNLHRKAFNVCKQLYNMEAEDLADFFAHFDYYCDASEGKVPSLRKRAGSVMRMQLGDDGVKPGPTSKAKAKGKAKPKSEKKPRTSTAAKKKAGDKQGAPDGEAEARSGNVRAFPSPLGQAAE